MISALAWVSRAAVKDVPIYGEPTPEELEELKQASIQGALGKVLRRCPCVRSVHQ